MLFVCTNGDSLAEFITFEVVDTWKMLFLIEMDDSDEPAPLIKYVLTPLAVTAFSTITLFQNAQPVRLSWKYTNSADALFIDLLYAMVSLLHTFCISNKPSQSLNVLYPTKLLLALSIPMNSTPPLFLHKICHNFLKYSV